MGSDLFGSFAESTCAALVVSGNYFTGIIEIGALHPKINYLFYPLNASATGILICIATSIIGIGTRVNVN
jgi:inorganic pyrophosphatase